MDALVIIGVVVAIAAVVWARRKRVDPYDLRRLHEPDPEPPGEAWDDMVDHDSGPYCSACDHPNPAGTNFCQSCGRKL